MLVLSQGWGDAVIITCPDGTEIKVVVTQMVRGKAHVGYDAPKNYVIDRESIHKRKQIEGLKANGNVA